MNVLLWVLQVALALLSFAGGAYKIFAFNEMAQVPATAALSRGVWGPLGLFEIVCGLLLVAPAVTKRTAGFAPLVALALALENLALAALDARYSLEVAATNPMVWALAMALMAAFVAFGRYTRTRPA